MAPRRGTPNRVVSWRGHLLELPRLGARYPARNGYYSRIRHVAAGARAVWTGSAESQREIQRLFQIGSARVPFCFDSERFNRHTGRSPEPTDTILSVSRLEAYKNHAAVIRAASRIASRPAVRLIGRGPEAGALRALADQCR